MDLQAELDRARAAADHMTTLRRKVGDVPGLVDGELQSLREGFETLMRDYGGATPRQRKAFRRELDVLAARIGRAGSTKGVSPKHLRVLAAALLHARTLHFANVRRALGKLDKRLALARELAEAREEYRRAYRGVLQEVEGLRKERDRLRAVPKPPLPRQRVVEVTGELEVYNLAARGLLQELLSDGSAAGLRRLLVASADPALGVPAPDDRGSAQDLVDFLGARPGLLESLGPGGVRALLDAERWSEARLSYFLVDPRAFLRLVQANLPWLRALSSPDCRALFIPWGQPADQVAGRRESMIRFLASCPGGGETLARLAEVSSLVASGVYQGAVDAQMIHQAHGEAAQRRFEGSLEGDLRALGVRLAEAERALEELARPEELSRG